MGRVLCHTNQGVSDVSSNFVKTMFGVLSMRSLTFGVLIIQLSL